MAVGVLTGTYDGEDWNIEIVSSHVMHDVIEVTAHGHDNQEERNQEEFADENLCDEDGHRPQEGGVGPDFVVAEPKGASA